MHLHEKTLSEDRLFEGKVVNLRKDRVELENGDIASREVVEHSGGVCVLPLLDSNEVIFVKQFRYAFKEILLEIPAGKLEKGENPAICGQRELLEEVGAKCSEYIYLGKIYPSPAYLSEIIHVYLAKGLTFSEQDLDKDEFLDVVKIPLADAVKMVMSNEIKDSKTQIAILKVSKMLEK